jgi:RNA polymerase sigma-70 factor, ECF subfamily
MADGPPDADTFTMAFAQCGRALWVLASAWVGREDADDLVQETARVAWQRRAQLPPDQWTHEQARRAWLAQIARHLGANWRRKRRAVATPDDELPMPTAPVPPPTGWPFDADRAGLSDELARALGALPEQARACLLLHVVVGLTFAEIAEMLEMPENTAMSHARRAREALRTALAPVHGGAVAAARRTR